MLSVHDFNLYDAVFLIPRATFRVPNTKQKFLEYAPLGPFLLSEDFNNGSHYLPYQILFGYTDVTFLLL